MSYYHLLASLFSHLSVDSDEDTASGFSPVEDREIVKRREDEI